MSRKIAVLGSAGQLGVELVAQLRARAYEVVAWDKPELDITDDLIKLVNMK